MNTSEQTATGLAAKLIASFPNSNLAAAEVFAGEMVKLLMEYPVEVAEKAITETLRTRKTIPSIAAVAEVLREQRRLDRPAIEGRKHRIDFGYNNRRSLEIVANVRRETDMSGLSKAAVWRALAKWRKIADMQAQYECSGDANPAAKAAKYYGMDERHMWDLPTES